MLNAKPGVPVVASVLALGIAISGSACLSVVGGQSSGKSGETSSCTKVYSTPAVCLLASPLALSGVPTDPAVSSLNLWRVNSDGTGLTPLTRNTAAGLAVGQDWTFSPDGSRILFGSLTSLDGQWNGTATASKNIWVMNRDGTGLTPLTRNTAAGLDSAHPRYFQGGAKIVFTSKMPLAGGWDGTPSGSFNIWVMNADGSGLTPLTQNTNASLDSMDADVSSDGGKIVFSSKTSLSAGVWNGAPTASFNIWVMNSDGTGISAITRNTAAGLGCNWPSISPDGKNVAFESRTDLTGVFDGTPSLSNNVWSARTDGTGLTPLTRNTIASDSSWSTSFSPDGTRIAFVSFMNLSGVFDDAPGSSTNIWTVRPDGSALTPLTRNTAAGLSSGLPGFSSDGKQILFTSSQSLTGAWNAAATSTNVWIIGTDGSGMIPLTQNSGFNSWLNPPGRGPACYQESQCL